MQAADLSNQKATLYPLSGLHTFSLGLSLLKIASKMHTYTQKKKNSKKKNRKKKRREALGAILFILRNISDIMK